MTLKSTILALAVTVFGALSGASAQCPFRNDVPVSMLSAGFEAWKVVTDAMATCGEFTADLDQEFEEKQAAAMGTNPPTYVMGGVSNGSLVPLLTQNIIRPLDDLVAEYGSDLPDNRKIVVDGQVLAVAMMVNSQHLMYRQDVFEELGLGVPTTYDEVLAAAKAIQEAGVVDYPLGGTYMAGWNLGLEFINMYLGLGGTLVNDDGSPAIDNETGVAALERLRELSAYMNPEFLASDSTVVQQQFQTGEIAMANLWASRAGAMDNPEESQVVGQIAFAAAPAARADGPPATTLWWDGMVVSKNATDEQAAAAFRLFLAGTDRAVLGAAPDAAIWLTEPRIESRIATGTLDSAAEGAPAYPASAAVGIMHTAVGDSIAPFLSGEASAEAVLADAETEYLAAAREAGLVD